MWAREGRVRRRKTVRLSRAPGTTPINKTAGWVPGRVYRGTIGSVFAQQAHQATLHLDPVGREDTGFVGRVGGFESDGIAAAAEALKRCFLFVDEGDDDLAG